ncbi:MAG TPA: endonuclease/exonuclease/phosphatase family protein, partial [Candidatus Krumholzibacteria bacterium]|nr:endonuclease/exonuclease/phosphatase family protein [Candidatus Krumholzibacteria bacterium]
MTWNLQNFPASGDATVELVAQAAAGLDVDIIALQEIVSDAAFGNVLAALDGWAGYRATGAPYDQNLAFLYRTDGRLDNVNFIEIYEHDSREFPRSPLVLSATWNGQPVVIINNHLKASGDGILDASNPYDEETRRRDACLMLADYISGTWAGTPVITVGDWNDELTDAEANNVFANFLDAPATWRFVDLPLAQDPSALKSYPKYSSHIDHILVTPELFAACSAPEALTEVVPIENGV